LETEFSNLNQRETRWFSTK